MYLTVAQRSYLELAARKVLPIDHIMPGPSMRCVQKLIERGLLRADFMIGEGDVYSTTAAGLEALASR